MSEPPHPQAHPQAQAQPPPPSRPKKAPPRPKSMAPSPKNKGAYRSKAAQKSGRGVSAGQSKPRRPVSHYRSAEPQDAGPVSPRSPGRAVSCYGYAPIDLSAGGEGRPAEGRPAAVTDLRSLGGSGAPKGAVSPRGPIAPSPRGSPMARRSSGDGSSSPSSNRRITALASDKPALNPGRKALWFSVYAFGGDSKLAKPSHSLLEIDFSGKLLRLTRKKTKDYLFDHIESVQVEETGNAVTVNLVMRAGGRGDAKMQFYYISPPMIQERMVNLLKSLPPSANCTQGDWDRAYENLRACVLFCEGPVVFGKDAATRTKANAFARVIEYQVLVFPIDEPFGTPHHAIPLSAKVASRDATTAICLDARYGTYVLALGDQSERDKWFGAINRATDTNEDELRDMRAGLDTLSKHFDTPVEKDNEDHVEQLRHLWMVCFGSDDMGGFSVKSERWKEIGFQSATPISDFRRTGMLGLRNLSYMCEQYPGDFQEVIAKQLMAEDDPEDIKWKYPVSAVGVNITAMLVDFLSLDLELIRARPKDQQLFPVTQTYPLFFYHPHVFEELYCISFRLFDRVWNEMMVGYLGFTKVIEKTRERVKELLDRPPSNKGVPAIFDLLGFERRESTGNLTQPRMAQQQNTNNRPETTPAVVVPAAAAARPTISDAKKERSEERRVGKECRSRWSPYH
eukprot:TRINITY_DN1419_c1_g1_i1.p1 TRINITY_DN1419_c1_g1~~TRINITY_DN1419_c1_g1_i1.p1  ORF type:complete len:680 (+),score=110.99 TRINITY_DN1419_c1_g1_i1:517-2556(+)